MRKVVSLATVAILAALTMPGCASAEKAQETPTEASGPLVVVGLVVDEDGVPLTERKLWVLGESGSFKLEEGRVLNPSAQSDKNGRFEIEVERSLFAPDEEFTVSCEYKTATGMTRFAPLHGEDGVVAYFRTEAATKKVDLGKVTFKEP